MAAQQFLKKFIAAYNNHDLEGVLANYDKNCEIVLNGKLYAKDIETIRKSYEKELSEPNAFIKVVRYIPLPDNNDDRCIRVIMETHDKTAWDLTYHLGPASNDLLIKVIASNQ